MKNFDRRLDKLEERYGVSRETWRIMIVVNRGSLALDHDTCIQVLDGAGLLHTAGFGVANLGRFPMDLVARRRSGSYARTVQ